MEFPFVVVMDLAEGVGNAPTSAKPILFSRQVQPAYICLPSKNWLPDLDSHQDKRFNKPPCYFDTIWQWRCRQDSHLHRSV